MIKSSLEVYTKEDEKAKYPQVLQFVRASAKKANLNDKLRGTVGKDRYCPDSSAFATRMSPPMLPEDDLALRRGHEKACSAEDRNLLIPQRLNGIQTSCARRGIDTEE
jgi:hypothetical protein